MAEGTVSSTPFRFFDLPGEIRDKIYSFLVVPEKDGAVGQPRKSLDPVNGCCYKDCDVKLGQSFGWYGPSSDQARGTVHNEGDRSREDERISQHQACSQIFRNRFLDTTYCHIHQDLASECRCPNSITDLPTRHYRKSFRQYRCLNLSKASKQLHQELTFCFFTRNTFEFHTSTDMLHFLRVYMPNHTNIIRSVSLIYHARTGSLPPRDRLQNVISNMDRESLMPALDLLAQLPNLQDFETILELRADRQIIIDRLTPRVRGGDPEVTKMLNAAKNAVTKSNIHDAVWTYWPASTERGPLPDNPEMSAGHSRRSHIKNCTQILNRFLDPILVRRNSLARIHDENTGEMWANGDYKTHLDLLDDADDVSDIIIALTECLTIYEEWKQESRHRKADPDRVQKLFDI